MTAARTVRADAVTADAFLAVDVAGRRVLLARVDDRLVAFEPACPHLGQPLTYGTVEDGCIVCPHHFYAFDAGTGAHVAPGPVADLALRVYPAEERDGWVWVDVSR